MIITKHNVTVLAGYVQCTKIHRSLETQTSGMCKNFETREIIFQENCLSRF